MSKAKSQDAAGWLMVVIGVISAWLIYRQLKDPKKVEAGTTAGTAKYPISTGTTTGSTSGNSLANWLKNLLSGNQQKNSSGIGAGGSQPTGSILAASKASLQNQVQAIKNFNAAALNTPNFADLGGQTLANYLPDVQLNDTIPYVNTSMGSLDFGDYGVYPWADSSSMDLSGLFTSYDTGDTIAYEPIQTFDFGSWGQDLS